MTTRTEARDEVMGKIKLVFDSLPDWTVLYQDSTKAQPKAAADGRCPPWARAVMKHDNDSESTIGGRRVCYTGEVTIQLFTPLGDGLSMSDVVSKTLVSALQDQSTMLGVTLRRARAVEIGDDGPSYQVNVVAVFEYEEYRT